MGDPQTQHVHSQCLLVPRADVVDEYVAAGKTLGIAEHNEQRLLAEGQEAVKVAFKVINASM